MSRSYTPGHVAAVAEFMVGLAGIDAEVTHRLNDLDFDAVGHDFSLRLRWNSPTVSVVTVETPESVRICGLVGDAFGRSERLMAALVSERPENGQEEASPGTKERWGRGSSPSVGWSPPVGDSPPAARPDVVLLLRNHAIHAEGRWLGKLCIDAADEIDRLRDLLVDEWPIDR